MYVAIPNEIELKVFLEAIRVGGQLAIEGGTQNCCEVLNLSW